MGSPLNSEHNSEHWGPAGGKNQPRRREIPQAGRGFAAIWAWEELNLRPHAYQARPASALFR